MNHHMTNVKRLYLSKTDKKWLGVCGGLGEYLQVDSTPIRLLWVIMTLVSGIIPGLIAYLIAAVVIPSHPDTS